MRRFRELLRDAQLSLENTCFSGGNRRLGEIGLYRREKEKNVYDWYSGARAGVKQNAIEYNYVTIYSAFMRPNCAVFIRRDVRVFTTCLDFLKNL